MKPRVYRGMFGSWVVAWTGTGFNPPMSFHFHRWSDAIAGALRLAASLREGR